MDEEVDVLVTVEKLRAAGTDLSKQVPALFKLGEWYLKKAKTTSNGADFAKANALYNAALVRSRRVNHEIDEDQILQRIVETYREFLYVYASVDEKISVDEIRHEIDSHKEFLVKERRVFKERVDEIDFCFKRNDKTDDQYQIHADQMHNVFRDIQDMYIRLVSMLVKECESRLGKPPCNYAIIALGSVARMEATPFSDLEFAILYSDPAIGDKINYFRVMSHFLHLKVINLGETILPALAIEELNDFQSSDPNSNWFYDSETPRGISFDGAMPWASKTALGRMATTNKPALELIRTPEEMAEFQDEEIAVKEGYHLAEIMSMVALLYGDQVLVNEYNERVAEKLNAEACMIGGKLTKTVGFFRGMQQMMFDLSTYNPFFTYLGPHGTVGGLFDAKKQFYRLVSLLLSELGMVFGIRSSSPWHISSELQARGIIGESESASIKVCLSIANKIRLKTYFANDGQRELFSPVPQDPSTAEKSADVPLFRDFGEEVVVHFLSTSNDIFERCHKFCVKLVQRDEIDISVFHDPSVVSSKATLLGSLYSRLQNFPKALEWLKSESKDSPLYSVCVHDQGIVYNWLGEYEESVKCFENALEVHYQNEGNSNLNAILCTKDIALTLLRMGKCEKARMMLEKAIKEHDEIHGKGIQTITRCNLMQTLARAYYEFGDARSALETYQKVEQMHSGLANVPDGVVIELYSCIAMSLNKLDQLAQSLEYMKRALQLAQKVYGESNLSITLVEIYAYAAVIYERCHLGDEALSLVTRGLKLLQLLFGDTPHSGKIDCLNKFGYLFYERNEADKAVESFENALRQARIFYHGKPRITVASTLNYLGMALRRAGKTKESLPCFQEAQEIMDEMLGQNNLHPMTSRILNNMIKVYQDLGDLGQAKAYCTKAVDIERKNPKIKNECPRLVFSLYELSKICEALEENGEALKHLEEAREIAKSAGSKHAIVVQVLFKLVLKYFCMLSFVKCRICLDEALEIAKTFPEGDAPPIVTDLLELQKQFGYSSR